MQVFINDTPTDCPEETTVAQLLAYQKIEPVNIAVAVDDSVIPKARWETTLLRDGSRIIIIKAVQGG